MPEGTKLQHEIGDLQYDSGDPLVGWMDLELPETKHDVFLSQLSTLSRALGAVTWFRCR